MRARAQAGREADLADDRVVTAGQVADRQDELAALLAQAQTRLDRLSGRAREVAAAEAAAARLRALAAAAARAAAAHVARATATGMPAAYRALYIKAARTCDGLPWTVLAAIGQVETGHGADTSMSSAGAQGPMQFMPATFAAYGVDGDGDGDTDIPTPPTRSSAPPTTSARTAPGRSDDALRSAIWHYNHADWYVDLVLGLAAQLAAKS